jgi:hypothetical protein
MAIGGVVINFAAKTADAIRDVDRLGRSMVDMGKGADAAGGRKGIGGLVSSMGAAIPVAGAVVIGIAGAATAMLDMARAAWEDKQQADKLAQTLGKIPGVTQSMIDKNEEWISGMQLATLVSDTELRAAISKLTLATGDLGEAQTLAALATDVAAGSGRAYATVADAMAKAASGNTTQLERMFPWLDKNKDGTVSLAEATEGLGKKFTGAAAAAAKNDPWRRIAIIWDEIQEIIGTTLLPVLEDLSDWFSSTKNQQKVRDFLNKMQDLADVVGGALKQGLEDLVAWLKKPENQQKLRDWADLAQDLASAFGDIAGAIGRVINAVNRIPDLPGWMRGGGLSGAGGILGGLLTAPPAPAGPTATTTAAPRATTAPAPPAPTVIVTEEQVYRAVAQLLMRGQARNGRLVMVR